MQIHELTSKKNLNEGFADVAKAAFARTKTGQNVANKLDTRAGGKLEAATQKYVQDLTTQWTQQWSQQAGVSPAKDEIQIAPGHKIQVSIPSAGGADKIYFKTEKGWTNEMGQSVTRPKDVAMLEKWADSGAGKEVPISEAAGQAPEIPPVEYIKQFKDWASEKLSTKETKTGTAIELSQFDSILAPQLEKVKSSYATGDNEATTQAISSYLMTAIKQIQKTAAEIRAKNAGTIANKTIKTTGNPAKDQQLKKDGWTVTL